MYEYRDLYYGYVVMSATYKNHHLPELEQAMNSDTRIVHNLFEDMPIYYRVVYALEYARSVLFYCRYEAEVKTTPLISKTKVSRVVTMEIVFAFYSKMSLTVFSPITSEKKIFTRYDD